MTRPARVIVNTAALRANLEQVRKLTPNSKIMAIVKADGYGHGVNRVGRALSSADAFGVASIEEASKLREGGIENRIVLLEGAFEQKELQLINALDLEMVVHQQNQVDMITASHCDAPAWIKIDSGMHRLGFHPDELADVVSRLNANGNPLRYMTHLANAHDPNDSSIETQLEVFDKAVRHFDGERSVANSAGILAWPGSISDWARPGIMLYGVSPFAGKSGADLNLLPAMTVKSQLISVREIAAGESVGYGKAYVCDERMPVGVVAFGYGDGYPRSASTGTPILVNGVLTQVIGEASMDMLTVDLRPVKAPELGQEVILWGQDLPVERIAESAATIPYELICRVRMRARYVEY